LSDGQKSLNFTCAFKRYQQSWLHFSWTTLKIAQQLAECEHYAVSANLFSVQTWKTAYSAESKVAIGPSGCNSVSGIVFRWNHVSNVPS